MNDMRFFIIVIVAVILTVSTLFDLKIALAILKINYQNVNFYSNINKQTKQKKNKKKNVNFFCCHIEIYMKKILIFFFFL
jgi:hypothetical protein